MSQVTDDALVAVLAFCQSLWPGMPCVKAQENDMPPPEPPYLMANPVTTRRIETNRHNYADGLMQVVQPVIVSVQVDFFGPDAQGMQAIFTSLWRDDYACRWMVNNGYPVAPLYTEDRQLSAYVNESEMYEQRWTCDASLQIDQMIVVPIDTANSVGPITITPLTN